jgi:hypothetical protein
MSIIAGFLEAINLGSILPRITVYHFNRYSELLSAAKATKHRIGSKVAEQTT